MPPWRSGDGAVSGGGGEGYLLDGLAGCGQALLGEVRSSFECLFASLAGELELATVAGNTGLQRAVLGAWDLRVQPDELGG